jgi:hypothetical protein
LDLVFFGAIILEYTTTYAVMHQIKIRIPHAGHLYLLALASMYWCLNKNELPDISENIATDN